MNWKQNPLIKYLTESAVELKKVTWPTRKETVNSTVVVVAVVVGVALFLGAVDFGLSELVGLLIN
jgi:preprotein translocase subunit SecE